MTTLATFEIVLRADTKQYETAMSSAQKTSQSFLGTVGQFAGGFLVAQLAMNVFNRAIQAGKDALIDYNAKMEQASIGFATLFGGGSEGMKKADQFVHDLQMFAQETPFNFAGLQQASSLMIGMGFAAQDIIPTLKGVGDMLSAMGRTGADSVNRVVWNLAQMKQLGYVTGRDVRDLAMLGVPVTQILAKGFGVSTQKMKDMISKGVVPADKAIKMLIDGIESSNMGGMMQVQAKTFLGAMSNIVDAWQRLSGNALKPLFEAIRGVVYQFSVWITTSQGAVDLSNKIATNLRAFVLVMEKVAPAAKAMVMGFVDGFRNIHHTIEYEVDSAGQKFAHMKDTLKRSGTDIIRAWAEGMVFGFRTYVVTVVNQITSYIASFMVGHSPPEMGPLADIYEGGKAVISAWVDGALAADLTPILDIPKKIATNLKLLEKGEKYVKGILEGIDRQIDLIDLNLAQLQLQAQEVTRRYEEQLKPLQKQYDLLMDTYSLADKKRDIELQLKKNALEQQILAKTGDWWAQAQLQSQLDAINQQIDQNRLLEEQENLTAQLAGIPIEEQQKKITAEMNKQLDPIQEQMDLLNAQRDQLQYQRQVWQLIAQDISSAADAMRSAKSAQDALGKGGIPETVVHDIKVDPLTEQQKKDMEANAQRMADAFLSGFTQSVKDKWPTILGAVIGGVLGMLSFTPFGVGIGATLGGAIGTGLSDQVKGIDLEGFMSSLFSGKADFSWLSTWFEEMGAWIIDVGIPTVAQAAGDFALAFTDWISQTALPWLAENLPLISQAIWDFIDTAIPAVIEKLGGWARAFFTWIVDEAVPNLLKNLPSILSSILEWITKATPIAIHGLFELAGQMVAGFVKGIIGLPGFLWDTLMKLLPKLVEFGPKAIEAIVGFAAGIGKALLNGLIGIIEGLINTAIRALNAFQIHVDLPIIGKIDWNGLNIKQVSLPRLLEGTWDTGPKSFPAILDPHEMVVPKDMADTLRDVLSGNGTGAGRGVVVNGPLIRIDKFMGTEGEVDDLMDKVATRLRLEARRA